MVIISASLDEKTGTDIDLIEDILQAIDRDGNGEMEKKLKQKDEVFGKEFHKFIKPRQA